MEYRHSSASGVLLLLIATVLLARTVSLMLGPSPTYIDGQFNGTGFLRDRANLIFQIEVGI